MKIIAVGKIKETFLKAGMADQEIIKIIEVRDYSSKEGASPKEEDQVKRKEGTSILEHISDRDYVVSLAIQGHVIKESKLRKIIEENTDLYRRDTIFVIGGSLGLCREVLDRSNLSLSIGRLTFPHQLMRVVIKEMLLKFTDL